MFERVMDEAFGSLKALRGELHGRQNPQTAPNKKTKGRLPDSPEFFVLVENKFFYRVALSPSASTRMSPEPHLTSRQAATFVATFREAWASLPNRDQDRLLDYWHHPPEGHAVDYALTTSSYHPLIQIVDAVPWPMPPDTVCQKLGHMLNFPISLIGQPTHRLRFEIAYALAMVYRLATRAHWRLIISMVDEPLKRWEKRHPGYTDDAYEAIQDQLEAAYMTVYAQEINQLLTKWGIEPPSGVGVSGPEA